MQNAEGQDNAEEPDEREIFPPQAQGTVRIKYWPTYKSREYKRQIMGVWGRDILTLGFQSFPTFSFEFLITHWDLQGTFAPSAVRSAEAPSGFSAEEKRPEAGSSAATSGADQEGKDGRHWAPG